MGNPEYDYVLSLINYLFLKHVEKVFKINNKFKPLIISTKQFKRTKFAVLNKKLKLPK